MKKKLVGIFIFGLLIATALPAIGTMNEREIRLDLRLGDKSLNIPSILQSSKSINRGGMFIQLPPGPEASNSQSWVSSLDSGYACFEDFWMVTDNICDVHWWGNSLVLENGTWYQRDPEGMTFNISFWDPAGFFVCSYEEVKPSITYTGIQHWSPIGGMYKKLYYFEAELDPCVNYSGLGWIGIQSTYCPSGGWFLWMRSFDGNNNAWQEYSPGQGNYLYQDLAVVLTDYVPANPKLGCNGSLYWSSVKPGETVNSSFVIANTGDNGSVLQWRIENSSLPTWGSNWTFTPSADFQTTDMGWFWVNVSVTAPPEENKKLTGKIKVVNAVDPSDFCEIDVSLNTPKSRTTHNTLLLRLFERFPNLFPILRYLSRL